MTRKDVWCVLLYLTFAVASGFADLRMRAYPQLAVTKFIPDVVAGTESAPGKYRVLVPFLNDAIVRVSGVTPGNVWLVTRLVWIFGAYCVMHVYLRTWFAAEGALTGVAIVAATLPLTFTNSWAHPDHAAEMALFPLAALAVARRSEGLFAVALPVAALNRETSVFLVMLYAVAYPLDRSRVLRTAAFAVEWFAVYAGLRAVRGLSHYDYWQAPRNWADLKIPLPSVYDPYYRTYAYFGLILFGPMVYVALAGRTAPIFIRRALFIVAPAFVVVCFLFSNIIESRIFTPLYALVIPSVLYAFHSARPSVPVEGT
jgi:hypothetical protein